MSSSVKRRNRYLRLKKQWLVAEQAEKSLKHVRLSQEVTRHLILHRRAFGRVVDIHDNSVAYRRPGELLDSFEDGPVKERKSAQTDTRK